MNLYIYSYNNYYNRIVKRAGNTINDYVEFLHYGPVTGVYGFTPGDGINTKQILGTSVQMYDGKGDYLIAHDPETNEIDSRWFIIDVNRTRGGQWELTLHRDLVVDYYQEILNSTAFIEKTTLPYASPLIFNEEDFTVNQIKTKETLLKDNSNCAWLVGYYDKKTTTLEGTVKKNETTNAKTLPYESISGWPFYSAVTTPAKGPVISGAYVFNAASGPALNPSFLKFTVDATSGDTTRDTIAKTTVQLQKYSSSLVTAAEVENGFVNYGLERIDGKAYTDTLTQEDINELLSYNGQTVLTGDGKYYNINISSKVKEFTVSINAGVAFNALELIVKNIGFAGQPNETTFKYKFSTIEYTVDIKEREDLAVKYNMTTERQTTEDAPWNIFAIPYGEVNVVDDTDTVIVTTNQQIAINTAMSIQVNHPSAVYDIQLLPYCPIQELIVDDGKLQVTDIKQYSTIVDEANDTVVGIIFNVPQSRFSFDLTKYQVEPAQTRIERKINNTCDKYRLTSPNYSNYFDFNVEKNEGIQFFNIDCEYKPYTPYVHINPNFKGLYGADFDDPRGLVLGGDFSISQVIDQWQQYQIQNNNYKLTFDRQIQNMEVQQKYGRIQDMVGALAGTVVGASSGAFAAGLIMPGMGGAGAVAGAGMSAAGGVADYFINEQLRNEQIDYTKDQFGYQLGNIQALPQTISKVSSLNNNNKLFPVLEYYTCTDEEKEALAQKLAWNGMTTMVIGKISKYYPSGWSYKGVLSHGYFKCKLIRLEFEAEHEEGLHSEDFRVVNAIGEELYKGVYIE